MTFWIQNSTPFLSQTDLWTVGRFVIRLVIYPYLLIVITRVKHSEQ